MKLALITLYPPRSSKHIQASGVASYTKNLVDNLPLSQDDQVYVLCDKASAGRETYVEDGVNVIRCFDRDPRFFLQLLKEIRALRPGVIHIQQELALFGGIATAYLLQWLIVAIRRYKVVVTIHGVVSLKEVNHDFVKRNNSRMPPALVKAAFYAIFRPIAMRSSRVIVHEQRLKEVLTTEYKIPVGKTDVIHHGVENLKAVPAAPARNSLQLSADKNIVLFMGYLTGYKGVDLLIEGFARYALIDVQSVLILGAGVHPKLKEDSKYMAYYKATQAKAAELIPAGQYRWVGFIDEAEIATYYSASDVSVYPYTIAMSSSGPMSIAIGYEKPFLASDVFKDAVADKRVLFQRDPEALAAKLADFFQHKDEFLNLSSGLKHERLWSGIGTQTMSVYQGLVREK
jgi:glycosyltransferase involved in cell wall biosynthesis